MTEFKTVASGDAHLAVRIEGAEGLPWLVLSNSLGTTMSLWDGQMPVLTRSHRVVRYDARGHGQSAATPGPYDFGLLVNDMVTVMDALGIAEADIMAMALGGMTALGLAIAHPDRVRRLVCCDARADAPPAFVEGWARRIESVQAGGMPAVLDETMQRWFTAAFRSRRPDIVSAAARQLLETWPSGYCSCAAALAGLAYLPQLPQLRAETLYVVGSEDTGATPETMRAMAEATPRGRLVVLAAVAHVSNVEAPEEFNSVVSGFLQAAA